MSKIKKALLVKQTKLLKEFNSLNSLIKSKSIFWRVSKIGNRKRKDLKLLKGEIENVTQLINIENIASFFTLDNLTRIINF